MTRGARYAASTAAVLGSTLLGVPLKGVLDPTNLVMLYLATVMGVAYWLGRGPSVWASILSVLAFDFCHVPPHWTFAVSQSQYLITFAGLLLAGLSISALTARAREKQAEAEALSRFTREVSALRSPRRVRACLAGALGCPVLTGDGPGMPLGRYARVQLGHPPNELEQAMLAQAAQALENLRLARARAGQRLQQALLRSLSHDLRIPLVSISGALESLHGCAALDEFQQSLVDNAQGEARRLTRELENLLQMTRIQAGVLPLKRVPCEVEDLVATAVRSARVAGRRVNLNIPPDLPLVGVDEVLIHRVLVNLLDNAAKYSPAGTPIEVSAGRQGDELVLSVRDQGPGIPRGERGRVFRKFYRGRGHRKSVPGTGLGLSICKALVEAHQGGITVEDAGMTLRLPI